MGSARAFLRPNATGACEPHLRYRDPAPQSQPLPKSARQCPGRAVEVGDAVPTGDPYGFTRQTPDSGRSRDRDACRLPGRAVVAMHARPPPLPLPTRRSDPSPQIASPRPKRRLSRDRPLLARQHHDHCPIGRLSLHRVSPSKDGFDPIPPPTVQQTSSNRSAA